MTGLTPPSSGRHRDAMFSSDSSDAEAGEEVMDLELLLDLVQHPFLSHSSPLEASGGERQRLDGNQNQDGDLWTCGQLDRRWVLWHEFMKEHAHLDAWLRLAEQAVSSLNPAHVSYSAAKEELKKFERLRCEAGSQLIQLDSLTRRNRTLTRLFQGAMQARLLASARECGQRWDDMNAKLESITGRLQRAVSEWEEFEAEREELALWLADMDARLTEIDHMTGNNCEKLSQLQSFQQSVCENSGRVNALLQRGELLVQCSEASDAHHVESSLLELLRRCSHVYNNIARTHTRLLSMRLVFEDDWILSQASDSGCPSETLHEDEGVFEKFNLNLPPGSNHLKDFRASVQPAALLSHHPPPPPPPSSASPTHEHLGLEWDPSVDIGRSVSHDDADSSYFSVSTGLCQRDDMKRWSYLSSFDSCSDISADITNQEVEPDECPHVHDSSSPLTIEQEEDQWTTSAPGRGDGEPIRFDGGRVKAWLRVQSSAPAGGTSCSKAVQTEAEVKLHEDGRQVNDQLDLQLNSQRCYDDTRLLPVLSRSSSHDLNVKTSWEGLTHPHQAEPQTEEEFICCDEAEPSVTSSSSSSSPLLFLLLAAAFALLAVLIWLAVEQPCHRSNRMHRSLHLTLSYINGPPPT
ncbi:uncharacterized protein si:ch211-137a8.2 [Kryptolebias marmoratus]|uniref:uncharacterized protein si:ch211-137a8.2 n=1 Tax=Kryptolebias marmoratus TaxID=37003 RepID=UPI0007F913FF|nr:uncharacterized protein si:ch211-137a8.2 [Kryptolebias marmoratus]